MEKVSPTSHRDPKDVSHNTSNFEESVYERLTKHNIYRSYGNLTITLRKYN